MGKGKNVFWGLEKKFYQNVTFSLPPSSQVIRIVGFERHEQLWLNTGCSCGFAGKDLALLVKIFLKQQASLVEGVAGRGEKCGELIGAIMAIGSLKGNEWLKDVEQN